MKVFVTGTDGYIGVMLANQLLRRGHAVRGCDSGFYRNGWLYQGVSHLAETLSKDIRHLEASDLSGCDAVVHLAELSNDPLGQLAPNITWDINYEGSMGLARAAKQAGIPRFVYFSSCSVYGATDQIIDEGAELSPLTAYAKCKVAVENGLRDLADDRFSPTILRNATAYGASPRQRFDLVVNNLAGHAWCDREIKMVSDGTPWRPLVHLLDICKAAACVLEAERSVVHGETFNVGDSRENYQVKTVAAIVSEVFPGCRLTFGDKGGDRRDYRVSFDKIRRKLPGFSCEWTVKRGAEQLLEVFGRIGLKREVFEASPYTRLKQISNLIETRQIDADFFWTSPA